MLGNQSPNWRMFVFISRSLGPRWAKNDFIIAEADVVSFSPPRRLLLILLLFVFSSSHRLLILQIAEKILQLRRIFIYDNE